AFAGGQDEQPWLWNSSSTTGAAGSAALAGAPHPASATAAAPSKPMIRITALLVSPAQFAAEAAEVTAWCFASAFSSSSTITRFRLSGPTISTASPQVNRCQ